MAYCRNQSTLPLKVAPCVALCNTFNSLCLKKASKNCFYEDYVLLRNQLLLLEYDDDDPIVPLKLYEITDMLRRYIEDVPKPIQETIEFVKDVHRKIFFLHGIASRDVRDRRKFLNSQELHLLLVRYVELEYEVLYSPENYSPEYQKQVQRRVLSLLLTILQDSESWEQSDKLEGNIEEICAMNTLYIMTSIRVEYKKQQNFIENIMIKLLRILNVLDKVSEMKNRNKTFQVDKLLQVPKVQKIFEYLKIRDYGLEDCTSEDEIEEVAEVATPVENEVAYEVEEKYDISSFACFDMQKKVMTIDLIDEDFSMVYFRPEVQKLYKKDKKGGFDSYNVQIPERTISNISDRFDKYIQLNSVTTSTSCDNKPLNSRSAISNDSVCVIDDDSDSDIEIIHDSSTSIVNLENDLVVSSELTDNKQGSPDVQKSKHIEMIQHLQSDINSLELEDALLQCDDISDNEIENEDEILNKYNDDADDAVSVVNVNDAHYTGIAQNNFPVSTIIRNKPEVIISSTKSTINNKKSPDQDNSHKDKVICPNTNHLNLGEKEFQNNDNEIRDVREINNDRLSSCNHANEINSVLSAKSSVSKIPTVSHINPHCTGDVEYIIENAKDENYNKTINVPVNISNLNKIITLSEDKSNIDITAIAFTNNHVLPQTNDSVADVSEVTEECIADLPPVNYSTKMDPHTLKEDHLNTHVKDKSPINSLAEVKVSHQIFESSPQTVSVTTANSSFTVATEESFISSTTQKMKSNNVSQIPLSTLPSEYNNTNAVVNDITLLNPPTDEYVKDTTELVEEDSIAKLYEYNQVSVKHKTSNEDDVVADSKVLGDINSNAQSDITDIVQNQGVCTEEFDVPSIAKEQELELSNEYVLPAEDNKSNQEQPEMVNNHFNIQEQERLVDVEDKHVSKTESLQCPNTKNVLNLETTKTRVITENKCVTSPTTVSYENQASCEDIEEYAGEFNAAFTDHTCSNNLVFFASVAAEQEKMENFIEMKQRGNKKKGRKVIKSNKNIEKPKKKTKKSELTEVKNNKEIGVVTRRVTRSSSAQLNYTNETQDHSKCIPSAFMNLENLVTPTPNRIYNLITETVVDNEESLDEPFSCLVNCENQPNSIDGQFAEIVAKNLVFDEDTIEDGISLVCHKKHQSNNNEVIISIPDTEKDYPGINYDILEQTEQFAETNVISNNCIINEDTHDGLNCKVLINNMSALSEGFYQSSPTETQCDVVPKGTNICINEIRQELIVESSTKIGEYAVAECRKEDIVESDNVVGKRFKGKETTANDHTEPLTVTENDSFNSNKLLPSASIENCELEVDLTTNDVKTDAEKVPVVPSDVSHEIVINEKEETICSMGDTETFNDLEPTVTTQNTPVDKTNHSEPRNCSPKKNRRKASANKTATLSMPVKKRQNYCKKNIIINKYEKKSVETDEIPNTEIEAAAVRNKIIDTDAFRQQEHILEKTLDTNKHDPFKQTKHVLVLDDSSSKRVEDNSSNEVSSTVTNENVINKAEKAVSCITDDCLKEPITDNAESAVQVRSDADAHQNDIIEENYEINIPVTEISYGEKATELGILSDNELQSDENYQDLQSLDVPESEIQQKVVNNTAHMELTEEEINSCKSKSTMVDCVTEAPELAVEDEVNSCKMKSITVDCVTEIPDFTVEEEINSLQTKSAVENVTEEPELTVELEVNSFKTKSATVNCVTEVPQFTVEEEINSCNTKSATADNCTNEAELAVEVEVNSCRTKSAAVVCITEVPEFTVEEEINSCTTKSATADSFTNEPDLIVEVEVHSSKTKSVTVNCVTEVPQFTVEEEINSTTADCVTEAPEPSVKDIKFCNTKLAVVDSVTESSEFNNEEKIYSCKTKSKTVNCVTEEPKLTVEEEINSSKPESAVVSCIIEAPELTVETTVNEIVPLKKSAIDIDESVQTNNNIELQQLQQSINPELVLNKGEQTMDDVCEPKIKSNSENENQSRENDKVEESIKVLSQHTLSDGEIQTFENNKVEENIQVLSQQILCDEEMQPRENNKVEENMEVLSQRILSNEEIQICENNKVEENIEVLSQQISSNDEIKTCENNKVEKSIEGLSQQILSEEEIQICETNEVKVPSPQISSEEEIQTSETNEVEVPSPQISSEEKKQTCETNEIEVLSLQTLGEKEILTCAPNEVPSPQILNEIESVHETVVSIENETSQNVIECTAEVLVESDKISNKDNNVSQTPPVLEKVIESSEIINNDNRKESPARDNCEFEDNQDTRTMPTLEREISLNQDELVVSTESTNQNDEFPDDSYPLLAAYEIEAVTEEVVESCTSDTESQKLLQSPVIEENINLETSSERVVEIAKETEIATHKEVAENSTDSSIVGQTKITAKITKESNSKIVKIVTNSNSSGITGNDHRDRNRRVLTKAALKSFQNPYVQLQKLPDNYDYKRTSSELMEKSNVTKLSEQRSKSQDSTSKRHKRDSRSLSESKHKKKHANLENSDSSKREKRVRQKEREPHSKKSNSDYFSERGENKSKDVKEETFRTKTRSSSQKQRDKEMKRENTKTLRSLSESKIELSSKQNEIANEKKSTPYKDKHKISKQLQLFSVEDSKITYYDKKKKQERETVKRDDTVYIGKGCDQAGYIKSSRKEEKSSESITDKNEEVANHKSPLAKDSSSRSSSRNDRKSSKHARHKTETEEIELQNKHDVNVTTDDANKSKNESSYSTRRQSRSRQSVSISRSTDNTKDDKTKKTVADLKDSKEKSKKNETSDSEIITPSSDSDKMSDDLLQSQITSDKDTDALANAKKSSDHKRHRNSRSSSKNSDIVKLESKDSEDTVHENKKPRIERNKENVCVSKSESDSTKKHARKKSISADIAEKNSNDLASKAVIIDMENVEPRVLKRERRESLRSSSSRDKAKIRSSLKENSSLTETDLTDSNSEICPLDLSEKPKEKLLKKNRKLSKKRRLSEGHACELEAKNSKISINKILMIEGNQPETTDCTPAVDCKVSKMEIKMQNRDTITNKQYEEVVNNTQTEELSENKNKKKETEKFNSARKDFDNSDCEAVIDAKSVETFVDKEMIAASKKKKEKEPKKSLDSTKNGKLLEDDYLTGTEKTENLIRNQEPKNGDSISVNCETVIDVTSRTALMVEASSKKNPELKIQDAKDVGSKMVIDTNNSELFVNNCLIDTSGEKNKTMEEKPNSKENNSKHETIPGANEVSRSTKTDDLSDSSNNQEKLEESTECKENNRHEIMVDTKSIKSLINDNLEDISNKETEILLKKLKSKNKEYINFCDVMDAKNTEILANDDTPTEKLEKKLQSKDTKSKSTNKKSEHNNHKMVIDTKNADSVINDNLNISSKKSEKTEKLKSKKREPKRIDFIIENLKNRNSIKKKEVTDLDQTEERLLDNIISETEKGKGSSKNTIKCDSSMEISISPQVFSEEHLALSTAFVDIGNEQAIDFTIPLAGKGEHMNHIGSIPDSSEITSESENPKELNDFERDTNVNAELKNFSYEEKVESDSCSLNKTNADSPQILPKMVAEKDSVHCAVIPSSVSEINDAANDDCLLEKEDLNHLVINAKEAETILNNIIPTNAKEAETIHNNSILNDNTMHEILEVTEFNKEYPEKAIADTSLVERKPYEVVAPENVPSDNQSLTEKFEDSLFDKINNSLQETAVDERFLNNAHPLEQTLESEIHIIVDKNVIRNNTDSEEIDENSQSLDIRPQAPIAQNNVEVEEEIDENSQSLDIRPQASETQNNTDAEELDECSQSLDIRPHATETQNNTDVEEEIDESSQSLDIRPQASETQNKTDAEEEEIDKNSQLLDIRPQASETPNNTDAKEEIDKNSQPLDIRPHAQETQNNMNAEEEIDESSHLLDIRPSAPETPIIINDDSLIEIPSSESDTAVIQKLKVPLLSNHILHFKDHTEGIAYNKHYNKNENCMNTIPISTTETMSSKNNAINDHAVPSTSTHSVNRFTVPSVSQVVVERNQIPTSVPLLDVHKQQSEEVIVNLSTSNAETTTSCETTDNLIAVIFSNVALCNNTEVINDSERKPNKTGFIYFRGTDHNYHSVGDPLLSGKCDNSESDHSSENSKEVPTPELENVLVDDNILPYIPILTENNLNQELSSSLSESPVDSSSDFQLLEQCLIGNTLGRESSPPLPQGCDNLYQTNLKQEVLDYEDNSASSNMEFSKESSEVYINQFQQQTMSVENMSELMNAVLTRIQNLNNMTRPTQRYDSNKENLLQPVAAEFNVSSDIVQSTNTNSFMTSHNLESDCNFVPMQEISNSYPESNVEYSNISFGNEVTEPVSFETDFSNFYYLPVAHDISLNNSCNKKVIVERIPQYPEQQIKSFTEINNVASVSAIPSSTASNRPTTNLNVKPTNLVKQPELTRSSIKVLPTTEIASTVKPSNLLIDKVRQTDVNSDLVSTSPVINVGFVRTSSRTRVSAPRPKKPSDRKSVDTRESEECGTDTDRTFNSGNKSDNQVVKLKVRADLGISNNSLVDTNQDHKIVPSKERSLCIIEDSNGLSTNKQKNTRLSMEENSNSKLDVRKSSNKQPKERDTLSIEDLSKLNAKAQNKQPKEDMLSVEDLNKLNPRRHSSSSKPQKQADSTTHVKNQTVELTNENGCSVKDAKSQTTDLITSSNVIVQNKSVDKHAETSNSDMIDNVKRRKRKPVDYIERVDYSSIDKILAYELENGRTPQKNRQRKEESEDISPRPKKRKQEVIGDKQVKCKTTCKPLNETERTKTDAVSTCDLLDAEPDVIVKPKISIFEDSDDDIPKKKKSKIESRLEPSSMNDLFDRLVKEGNVNTIKNSNALKSNKEATVLPSTVKENDVQKFNKNALDPPHASNSRTISNNIFNLEHKKPDAITPVKQIGVVNPIPRSSNVVRKEPPCNRNSYGGSEESRNSSQYYPYYSERSRRSYPYSNRESNRSNHQGSSRRMEYQPHSSDQRYSSQRSSSSGRSSRSSRHHSNSRSSTEQRNYNRYASSAATDLAWREDMKKKFPNMFKDEVYF